MAAGCGADEGGEGEAGRAVLQGVIGEVEAGVNRPNIDRVFGLDDVVAAHRYMENNQATGKVVVLPSLRPSACPRLGRRRGPPGGGSGRPFPLPRVPASNRAG